MSVAVETPRSRAGLLSSQLERLQQQRDKIDARLAELPGLIEDARAEALKRAPTQRTDSLNSPVQRLHAETQKKVGELDRLNAEIAAVERELSVARREEFEDRLKDSEREGAELTAAEEKLWRDAGALLTDLAVLFARLRDECWEPRERRREDLRHGELANVLNGSEEAEDAFQGAWCAPIRPLPVTFPHFVAFCVEATSDPHGRGYRDGVVFDEGRRIIELLPELNERPAYLLRTEKWQTAELPFGG